MFKVNYIRRMLIMAGLLVCLVGCNDPFQDGGFKVTETVPAATWLSERPEYSEWVKILKKTDMLNALNAGIYQQTIFVADNNAVARYVARQGASSIDDLSVSQLTILVQTHVIPNNLVSASNMYLRLPYPTASRDYLTAELDPVTEERYLRNTQDAPDAYFIETDIVVSNGLIHVLDNLLNPVTEMVLGLLESDPDYSIFTDVVKRIPAFEEFLGREERDIIGYNTTTAIRDYKTVLVVPDAVYNERGIYTYDDLLQVIGNDNKAPTDTTSNMFQYMAYHVAYKNWSLVDIGTFPAPLTGMPYVQFSDAIKYPLSSRRGWSLIDKDNELWFNDHVDKIAEPLATFRISKADIFARNGVLHEIDNVGVIPSHQAYYTIEWEFTDFIELSAISFYRREATADDGAMSYSIAPGEVDAIRWETVPKDVGDVAYWSEYVTGSTPGRYLHQDALYFNLGVSGWLEVDGPKMSAGQYQIKCEKSNRSDGGKARITFGSHELGTSLNFIDGSELATWGAPEFAGEDEAVTPFRFEVSMNAGICGVDRIVFLPTRYSFDPVL